MLMKFGESWKLVSNMFATAITGHATTRNLWTMVAIPFSLDGDFTYVVEARLFPPRTKNFDQIGKYSGEAALAADLITAARSLPGRLR